MMVEKEHEMQEQNHVQMSQEMIHHHHDHERYDQVQYDQEQKLCANTISHIVHIRVGARCVWHRKERATGKRHNRRTATLREFRWISCSLVQRGHSWMNRDRSAYEDR